MAGKVVVSPVPGYLEDYSGAVCVPGGVVEFQYKDGGYTAVLPDGTRVTK